MSEYDIILRNNKTNASHVINLSIQELIKASTESLQASGIIRTLREMDINDVKRKSKV